MTPVFPSVTGVDGVALDPGLILYRVTEFIAAGIAVLGGAGWSEEERAGFAFAWSGLAGRRIVSWADPMRFFGVGGGHESAAAGVTSYVEVEDWGAVKSVTNLAM